MLIIKCDCCKQELSTPGALLFSPPSMDHCKKLHLCVECYALLMTYVNMISFMKQKDDSVYPYGHELHCNLLFPTSDGKCDCKESKSETS